MSRVDMCGSRPFEQEGACVPRAREPVQEPLRGVAVEREVEVLVGRPRRALQPVEDRCCDVDRHDYVISDSRYGLMTFSARSCRAHSPSSAMVALRAETQSRSASTATSMPILLR